MKNQFGMLSMERPRSATAKFNGLTGLHAMIGNYSTDEIFALVLGFLLGIGSWGVWVYELAVVGRLVRQRGQRWLLVFVPLVCACVVFIVLKFWSAEDVRTDSAYIFFYMVISFGWIGMYRMLLPLFGLNARDEVLERGNKVAGWTFSGALFGGTCCFAGANIGNGPGWWVVIFSALLATVSLLFLWWIVHCGSGISEKVTIDRDPATGLRAAGFFMGAGLILGRAVAGDWVSIDATAVDFARMSWPALVLAGVAITVERSCSPKAGQGDFVSFFSGWLPASVYVAAGVVVMFAW